MKPKFKINIHIIIITTILITFGISIFILLRWDKGVESTFDPDYISTEFDIEELDFIMYVDPAILKERKDDGELHILCLGNNPFTDMSGATSLAELIADKTGGTTYNGAFPDSTIATKSQPENLNEFFSLFYVTMALVYNDYRHLEEAALKTPDKRYITAVNTLKALDMEKIDIILIMYDTTDYNRLSPSHNPENDYDLSAYTGSLRTSIESIKDRFPHIRIILMSHSYALHLNEDGELLSGTITDLGHGNVPHYLIMGYNVALNTGITFIDNYFGTIHEENYHEYMIDHMRYNDSGRSKLAGRAAEIILR